MKDNYVLAEQSSHSALLGDKDLMYQTLLEILSIGKGIKYKILCSCIGKGPIRYY